MLALKDVPIGSSMVAFAQITARYVVVLHHWHIYTHPNGQHVLMSCSEFHSSIFVSVAQTVFANGLTQLGIQGVDESAVATSGLTDLIKGMSGRPYWASSTTL